MSIDGRVTSWIRWNKRILLVIIGIQRLKTYINVEFMHYQHIYISMLLIYFYMNYNRQKEHTSVIE